MDIASTAAQNLTSPVILFFLLGILAGVLKSNLTIPETLSKSVSMYLIMVIGFRGGVELSHNGFGGSIGRGLPPAVALSAVLPLLAYALLRWTTSIDSTNAAAVSGPLRLGQFQRARSPRQSSVRR